MANAADVLTRMAEWFSEPSHWTKGTLARDSNGDPADEPKTAAAVCLVGGLFRFTRTSEVWSRGCAALIDAVAARFGRERINIHGPAGPALTQWNDYYAESHRDVVELCHEAALIAKRSEDES